MNLPNALYNSNISSKIHSSGKTKISALARMYNSDHGRGIRVQTVPITPGDINNVSARIKEEHTQSSLDSSASD
jgi:hypothetical protein